MPLREVAIVGTDRTTTLEAHGARIATVEHLLAACAALGLHDGLAIEVGGGEVPLLDGASLAFVEALGELGLDPGPPRLVVHRDAVIESGVSRYTFHRATVGAAHADAPHLSVTVSFDDPRIGPAAAWDGTSGDFARIGAARTFAFAREVEALIDGGLASHVDPKSVVVIASDEILCQGATFTEDEPARHKLLDLMGDLFIHGGPPRGSMHAFRPGHRATHEIMRKALETGVVGR